MPYRKNLKSRLREKISIKGWHRPITASSRGINERQKAAKWQYERVEKSNYLELCTQENYIFKSTVEM